MKKDICEFCMDVVDVCDAVIDPVTLKVICCDCATILFEKRALKESVTEQVKDDALVYHEGG